MCPGAKKPRASRPKRAAKRTERPDEPPERSASEKKLRKTIYDVARERSQEKKETAAKAYTEKHSRKPVKRRKTGAPLGRKPPQAGDPKAKGRGFEGTWAKYANKY